MSLAKSRLAKYTQKIFSGGLLFLGWGVPLYRGGGGQNGGKTKMFVQISNNTRRHNRNSTAAGGYRVGILYGRTRFGVLSIAKCQAHAILRVSGG